MQQRNIGLDILRILLAFMIITHHFNFPRIGDVSSFVTGSMKHWVTFMVALCYPAVNAYLLITGFFSYSKKKSIKRVIKSLLPLWFCLLFFQLFGYALSLILGKESFSVLVLIKHFFPLARGIWWFMSVYFVLMLISPALNMIMDRLSKKEYLVMMAVALLLCSVIPFFAEFKSPLGLTYPAGGLIWFVVLYMTGSGLFKYYLNSPVEKPAQLAVFAVVGFLLLTLYLAASSYIHSILGLDRLTLYSFNSIVVYGQAVLLFLVFWGLPIRNQKLSHAISFMASLSFAVYVFHCQEDVSRFIWLFLQPYKYANSPALIPVYLLSVFGIYFISTLLEFVRRTVFSLGNFEKRLINRILATGARAFE